MPMGSLTVHERDTVEGVQHRAQVLLCAQMAYLQAEAVLLSAGEKSGMKHSHSPRHGSLVPCALR